MNLKQKLSKKLKKTGGFTLIEMLIVVAIIAILVAVSIPMVNSSLDKARTATDEANERAAKAAALATYMLSDDTAIIEGTGDTATATYYYDAETGNVQQGDVTDITGYNQTKQQGEAGAIAKGKGCVKVKITVSNGNAVTSWVAADTDP